ncbi:MAG: hypothetical protein ACMUIS_11140 [bacterium]
MKTVNAFVVALICIAMVFMFCGLATEGIAQVPYLYPFWGFSTFGYPFGAFPPVAPVSGLFPPSYPALPYYSPPSISAFPRIGAATIIVTNPTAGTVSVINPTVAAPTVATAPASPPPLLSLLATIYTSALYEGALSTANPLLFALLQNLFL